MADPETETNEALRSALGAAFGGTRAGALNRDAAPASIAASGDGAQADVAQPSTGSDTARNDSKEALVDAIVAVERVRYRLLRDGGMATALCLRLSMTRVTWEVVHLTHPFRKSSICTESRQAFVRS